MEMGELQILTVTSLLLWPDLFSSFRATRQTIRLMGGTKYAPMIPKIARILGRDWSDGCVEGVGLGVPLESIYLAQPYNRQRQIKRPTHNTY
jgi:hypothetical protein